MDLVFFQTSSETRILTLWKIFSVTFQTSCRKLNGYHRSASKILNWLLRHSVDDPSQQPVNLGDISLQGLDSVVNKRDVNANNRQGSAIKEKDGGYSNPIPVSDSISSDETSGDLKGKTAAVGVDNVSQNNSVIRGSNFSPRKIMSSVSTDSSNSHPPRSSEVGDWWRLWSIPRVRQHVRKWQFTKSDGKHAASLPQECDRTAKQQQSDEVVCEKWKPSFWRFQRNRERGIVVKIYVFK